MATAISTCNSTKCAFNANGCTALAITIGGSPDQATCGTFVQVDARSVGEANGQVGACKRLECAHNTDLMCTANAITVGGDVATCLTYAVR